MSTLWKGRRQFWFGLMILGLLINSVYLYLIFSTNSSYEPGGSITGAKIMKAAKWKDNKSIAITTDSKLLLLNGTEIEAAKEIEGIVTDFAFTEDRSSIYIGTNDRRVYVLDSELNEVSSFPVNGKVIALDTLTNGGVAIAYGIGQYTSKFWVGQFDDEGNSAYETRIGMDLTSTLAAQNGTYFGTADSKVGLLSAQGKELWRTTLIQPITRLSLSANQQLLAGDERGNVTLLSVKGEKIWSLHLSEYPITMLEMQPANYSIAGDKDGNVFILNQRGELLYNKNLNQGALNSLIHYNENELVVLTESGQEFIIHVDSALSDTKRKSKLMVLIALDVVLLLGIIGGSMATVPSWRRAALLVGRKLKRSKTAYMLILPSIVLIIVFNVVPAIMAVFYSFTNFSLKEPLKFIGWANFVKIKSDPLFWIGIWNMILVIVTSIIKELTMPLLAAELIFWLKNSRWKYFFRTAFVVPSIVPGVVVILLWKMMYEPEIGFINQFFGVLGLQNLQQAWLGNEKLAIWSVIGAGFPFIGVFSFLIYFGGLIGISREIYDSSEIDGVRPWSRFLKIDLPMILPQIRVVLFFTFIGSIQGFANILIFTRGGPGTSTYVPGLHMYNQISSASFGYASAIGVVLAILVLVGTIFNAQYSKQVRE
ncbi:ABC transporter permease subunit [Paenibacillus contaminans]|uniref:ABC transmembrane type-1 domain-containing protein n=1 Tax=Paenibacillus contaminans TaxID=450362 RepID=A0A329MCK7_9BACL|nr:ABC transporter permease subunit [Paenibacillus contaminans]RAV17799.1 hypothetical protein DQG23_25645 [Paenibacillus contaminans]